MNELDPNTQPPNPYPWLKPMPVMWFCVILCIVLIILGSWLSPKKTAPPPATPQQSPVTTPGS